MIVRGCRWAARRDELATDKRRPAPCARFSVSALSATLGTKGPTDTHLASSPPLKVGRCPLVLAPNAHDMYEL